MKWENLDKKSSQEEIIITEGDWSYKKVSTQKGCPFYIQNTSYPDDKYYFYFQTKNKENIEKIEKSLEDILKTGKLPGAPESNETQNVPMSIEEMQKNAELFAYFKYLLYLCSGLLTKFVKINKFRQ